MAAYPGKEAIKCCFNSYIVIQILLTFFIFFALYVNLIQIWVSFYCIVNHD